MPLRFIKLDHTAMSLRKLLRPILSLGSLLGGLLLYWLREHRSERAHQALIQLFCASGGWINDAISACIGLCSRRIPIASPAGVLGRLDEASLKSHLKGLLEDGCLLFPQALSTQVCDRLMHYASSTTAILRRMDNEPASGDQRREVFDPANPKAIRYDYPTDGLLNNEDVQDLLADASILALTQAYLGAPPRADVLSMWWHSNFHTQPDSEAAQFFHFDMDRIRWLKIFIYLTDVGADNGPHCFVKGSHRTDGIPPHMLRKGYVRLSDEEVLAEYTAARCIEFTAPRGSIIVEDTRGLHKGASVVGSPRLILQLQFSNSLFGANYPRASISRITSSALAKRLSETPSVYHQYT